MADGRIRGVRKERRGRTYSETAHTGSHRPISLCRVAIERGGHPRYSLGPTIEEVT
jgi:hypothetical protein